MDSFVHVFILSNSGIPGIAQNEDVYEGIHDFRSFGIPKVSQNEGVYEGIRDYGSKH